MYSFNLELPFNIIDKVGNIFKFFSQPRHFPICPMSSYGCFVFKEAAIHLTRRPVNHLMRFDVGKTSDDFFFGLCCCLSFENNSFRRYSLPPVASACLPSSQPV